MSGREWTLDALWALFLVLWSQSEIWGTGADNLVGPAWLNAAAFGVQSALALLRRWRPLPVLLAQCTLGAALFLAVGATEALAGLLPVLLGLYTVAAHESRRRALCGLAAASVLCGLQIVRDPLVDRPADGAAALPFVVLVLIVVLLGRFTRTRALYVAELRRRTKNAERDREMRARLATLDERERIAGELHDVIAHGITVMVRQADAASARLVSDPDRARTSIDAISNTGREALAELRTLVTLLERDNQAMPAQHADSAAPQPGLQTLASLADRVTAAGLPVQLRQAPALDGVAPGTGLAGYRIVQEALTNAMRHAGAASATVDVRRDGADLVAEVVDDGDGMLPQPRQDGRGLPGMHSRAQMYGGSVEVGPAAPHGTRVLARFPGSAPTAT